MIVLPTLLLGLIEPQHKMWSWGIKPHVLTCVHSAPDNLRHKKMSCCYYVLSNSMLLFFAMPRLTLPSTGITIDNTSETALTWRRRLYFAISELGVSLDNLRRKMLSCYYYVHSNLMLLFFCNTHISIAFCRDRHR